MQIKIGASFSLSATPNPPSPVAMPDVRHATVFFQGRVQGVGFRYAAMQVAREYEVAGFVRNLADGRVLLEVEGRAEEIDAFVAAVEARMTGYIRKVERSHRERPPQFSGFVIR
jgi:acylphosphatase